MKRIEKYVYPVIFVIFTWPYLLITGMITRILTDIFLKGDWAGLGILLIAVIIWLVVIAPIYCIKYSKIIQCERFKLLFAFYNAFVIVGCYMLPLLQWRETYLYGLTFFIWTLFWSVLLLKRQPKPHESEEDILKEAHVTDFLFENKTKTIIAICITLLYVINLASDSMVWQIYDFYYFLTYTLPFLSVIIFLVFLVTKNIDYSLKKWILPLVLGGDAIRLLYSICLTLTHFERQQKSTPNYHIVFVFVCLITVSAIIMFIGTLFNFKYKKLLKYGALSSAILRVGLLIFHLINLSGGLYHYTELNGPLVINPSQVIATLLPALYFGGIFILTTNKKTADPVNISES